MNKQEQQIKKMASTCSNYHSCSLCPYNPKDRSYFIGNEWVGSCPNYDKQLVYAMGKGYRKAEEVRRETAKEILQALYDKCYEYDVRKPDKSVGHIIPLDILTLAKHYGVEVEQ